MSSFIKILLQIRLQIYLGLIKISCVLNLPFIAAVIIKLCLFKLKGIEHSKNQKKILIVFYRTGGIHDLLIGLDVKQLKKKILFLDRSILRKIFDHFHKGVKINAEANFKFDTSYEVYLSYLVKRLNALMNDFSILAFNFSYIEEIIFRKVAFLNKNACKLLYKECFRTEAEYKVHNDKGLHEYLKFYSNIAVYNNNTKKHFQKRLKHKNNVEIVGCGRALISYNTGKVKSFEKVQNILFYYFPKYKGMPTRNSKFTYFKESGIKKHKPISWLKIINEIFDAFIELAKKHKNINFIIKAKKGEMESNYYIKKISNLNLKNLKYLNSGAGHELIKNSQVIIGMNSAAIVESIAAKRKIFIPFFSSYRKKLYEQYTLNCPRTLMVKNKQDLKINIEKLIKQKYLKFPVDIKNYEKILLEYFGDVKNSKKTITDFINK